jgi:hypothetical protein
LSFGNGVANQPTNTLFFTAGPNDEQHGLYGRIDVITAHNGNDDSLKESDNSTDDSGNSGNDDPEPYR